MSRDLKEVRRETREYLGNSFWGKEAACAKPLKQKLAWCSKKSTQARVAGWREGGKKVARREAGAAGRAWTIQGLAGGGEEDSILKVVGCRILGSNVNVISNVFNQFWLLCGVSAELFFKCLL